MSVPLKSRYIVNRIRYSSNRLRWRTPEGIKVVESAFLAAFTNHPLRPEILEDKESRKKVTLHRRDLVLKDNKLIENLGTRTENKDNEDDKEMSLHIAIIDVVPLAKFAL